MAGMTVDAISEHFLADADEDPDSETKVNGA
jgi:hypothetical protein